ncbi:hypothetical protein D1007_53933 [Hordeum vulgare]|nr:hypothetical protein D1007_53933 [Hordeum vulgare]
MLTTYKTIRHASVSRTYSIKVDKANLEWLLRVYGMVAARDHVDYNRNYLFNRKSDNCQIITADVHMHSSSLLGEPYLTLTGPSRAVLFLEPVDFEVDLKFKKESEDGKALINQVRRYQRSPRPLGTILCNNLCTIRFHYVNQDFQVSVQAYSECGSLKVPIATGDAVFKPEKDGVTERGCDLGDSCRVKIKVAWSLLSWSKLLLQGQD